MSHTAKSHGLMSPTPKSHKLLMSHTAKSH